MLQVKRGQVDKMGLLFERYHRSLFGFFYHLCSDGDTSEDLVQTVFYRMLKYRHTFTGEGLFTTWMYHIARNTHADYYRKQQRHPINAWAEVEDITEQANSEGNDEQVGLLQRALQLLSQDKKEVLLMSRYQGLRYREIADILQCSEANVKVRVFRAIQELRTIFKQLERQRT